MIVKGSLVGIVCSNDASLMAIIGCGFSARLTPSSAASMINLKQSDYMTNLYYNIPLLCHY